MMRPVYDTPHVANNLLLNNLELPLTRPSVLALYRFPYRRSFHVPVVQWVALDSTCYQLEPECETWADQIHRDSSAAGTRAGPLNIPTKAVNKIRQIFRIC